MSGATRKTVRHGERQRTPVHSYPYFLDAHKTVWALKFPVSIYFCEHISQHTFTIYFYFIPPNPRSPNVMCCQARKISVHPTFFFFFLFSCLNIQRHPDNGSHPWRSVGLLSFHVQVFEATYLSTYALPHIIFIFLWPQIHSMLLKTKKEKHTHKNWPVGRPQHFILCKALKICEALPVLQTENVSVYHLTTACL